MKRYLSTSDSEKAGALARLDANGGNVLRTARELGLAESTLRGWDEAANRGRGGPEFADMRDQKRHELAEKLENVVTACLDAMPAKIADAPLSDVARTLGIAIDKMLLLRGKPTEIVEQVQRLTPEEARRELAELLWRGRERQLAAEANGHSPGGPNGG